MHRSLSSSRFVRSSAHEHHLRERIRDAAAPSHGRALSRDKRITTSRAPSTNPDRY